MFLGFRSFSTLARAVHVSPLAAACALTAAGCGSPEGPPAESTAISRDPLIVRCTPPSVPICSDATPAPGGGGKRALLTPISGCTCSTVMTFTPVREYGVQPGWARATFSYATKGESLVDYGLTGSVTCAAGTSPSSVSVTAQALSSSLAAVDVRANGDWLAANGFPRPCEVTSVTIGAQNATPSGTPTLTNTFAMDVPFSELVPSMVGPIRGGQVSLRPPTRRYAAYPPLIVAIATNQSATALMEVEELPERGTVGLRGLATFFGGDWLGRELGGGAQIYPGWGVDADLLGVTKATSGVEESHPGFDFYASPASALPPLDYGDPWGLVYPAPPMYSEDVYLANVLDNRGVPRCESGNGCLDVVYDANAHVLNAINGAQIVWVEGPAIQPASASGMPPILPNVTSPSTPPVGSVVQSLASRAPLAPPRPPPAGTSPSPNVHPIALTSATPLVGKISPNDAPACPLTGATSSVPLTQCSGFTSSFPCPTKADPIPVEKLPPPGRSYVQLSLAPMMPEYAGRSNEYGTCESHAATQYFEYLMNKLGADMAAPRTVTVDGQAIVVPNPLLAYSVTGGLADLLNWGGTRSGEPDPATGVAPSPSTTLTPGMLMLPQYINAYWPAYETDWLWWAYGASAAKALSPCQTLDGSAFWKTGFCMGQGQPPPGVYWSYNEQLKNELTGNAAPFSDMPWSLASTHLEMTYEGLDLSDRDAAIQKVIALLQTGMPVWMTFPEASQAVTDSAGRSEGIGHDMTWFVPPELAGCDADTIRKAFQPNTGHAVNVVGYSLYYSGTQPDLFRSYFIVENNWGKGSGYGGYWTMNLAAFKLLASSANTYHLRCNYDSVVCDAVSTNFFTP
jgi:hypothetical protein